MDKILGLFKRKSPGKEPDPNASGDASEIQKKTLYDQYKIPPDISIALLHQKAKKIGLTIKNYGDQVRCPCCNNPTIKQDFKLGDEITLFAQQGQGYTLFFQYLKYNIYLISVLFFFSGLHQFVKMLTVSCNADDKKCYKFLFLIYYKEINAHYMLFVSWINFACVIMLIIYLGVMNLKMLYLAKSVSVGQVSPSNFSVIVSNINQKATEDNQIKKLMEKKKIKVIRIMYMYKINYYLENIKKKNDLVQQRYILEQSANQYSKKYKAQHIKLNSDIGDCDAIHR